MREMSLTDLINLMWSALEIKKGTATFFNELEKILTKRLYKIKDEDFHTLITCFSEDMEKN